MISLGRVAIEVVAAIPTWPLTRGAHIERVDTEVADGWVRGEWVIAPNCDLNSSPLLYLHGGGYVLCSPRTHRVLTTKISELTRRPIFVLDYRMAPEHQYPAALDDARLAYEWLVGSGNEGIGVAGDSAGGHLALCLAREVRLRGLPELAAIAAFSPLVDLSSQLAMQQDKVCREPILPMVALRQAVELFLGGVDPVDQRIALLQADLRGFPPTLLQVGGSEFLSTEVAQLGSRLLSYGVEARVEIWPEQIHVFQTAWPVLPESRAALANAAQFLNQAIAQLTSSLGEVS